MPDLSIRRIFEETERNFSNDIDQVRKQYRRFSDFELSLRRDIMRLHQLYWIEFEIQEFLYHLKTTYWNRQPAPPSPCGKSASHPYYCDVCKKDFTNIVSVLGEEAFLMHMRVHNLLDIESSIAKIVNRQNIKLDEKVQKILEVIQTVCPESEEPEEAFSPPPPLMPDHDPEQPDPTPEPGSPKKRSPHLKKPDPKKGRRRSKSRKNLRILRQKE